MNKNNKGRENFSDLRQKKSPKMPRLGFGWIYILISLVLIGIWVFDSDERTQRLDWSQFQTLIENDAFSEVVVYTDKANLVGTVKKSAEDQVQAITKSTNSRKRLLSSVQVVVDIPSANAFNDLYQKLRESDKPVTANIRYDNDRRDVWVYILNWLPFVLLIFFWVWMSRRMMGGANAGGSNGIFNVGKSRAQLFDKQNNVNVTFKDVAGLSGAKQEVEEIVHFLREPGLYTRLGGKIPKGALLVGPPGTGKTLLAKAVAGEAEVPFFSLSGSDFVEMFVGVGASRVRDLFKTAKEKAPCIVFIDEIDAVGRARGKNAGFGGNDERENTLNQLLTEMDGFGTNSGVIIMAATNRVDILDKALLRAGRFDRQITVDLPDLTERKEIFQVHMRNLQLDDSIDIDLMARQTPGFSGADIANVCNEAALIAARSRKTAIGKEDFMNAIDRIIGGLERKTTITTAQEKKTIALHEAGHATVSWLLEHANPLVKITIVPRGRALGAAWYLPEERQITTQPQLLDEMCAILGGRAAEEVALGEISTGAANDLQRVTKMAQAMVTYFGMSSEMPNLNYHETSDEYGFTKPYSEETARKIDKEVLRIVNEQYERAKAVLQEHKEQHQELANLLYEKEVIYTEDVERILGKRPWVSRADQLIQDNEEKLNKADLAS